MNRLQPKYKSFNFYSLNIDGRIIGFNILFSEDENIAFNSITNLQNVIPLYEGQSKNPLNLEGVTEMDIAKMLLQLSQMHNLSVDLEKIIKVGDDKIFDIYVDLKRHNLAILKDAYSY